MIKKVVLSLFLAFSMLAANASFEPSDEGMWLPILLKKYNYDQMKKLGLKLKPEQIYDVNKASLKDAILWFGGGCTGEIVSGTGLVLTNHHCGYGAIQSHSTVQDNILDNGFWAKTLAEEKQNAGLSVSLLVRMEDVSSQIMPALMGLNDEQKAGKIKELSDTIAKRATNGTHYEAFVKDIFKNNQYILYVMERFTDIRLVGTPPQNIGKFGGDTDNWMWPRHTGDYSMFRIYANKENKPADYSTENVPYKPKYSLSISLDGVKEGDYAMIMGFPGRTNRYETAMGIQMAIDKVNPAIVKLREKRLELMKQQMSKDVAVRIQLSSRYAQIANYWKYFIGQTEQIKRLKVVDQKKADEAKFKTWATGKAEYANLFNNIDKAYAEYLPICTHRTYLSEGILGSIILNQASGFASLDKALAEGKEDAKTKAVDGLKKRTEAIFKLYNPTVEENILAAMLGYFYSDIPKDQHPAILGEILAQYPGVSADEAFTKYAASVMANSMMVSQDKINAFLANPTLEALNADPAYKLVKAFNDNYDKNYKVRVDAFNAATAKEGELYIKGLMAMDPTRNFYPDANSTFRLTYGSVKGYTAKDAVVYKHFTTLDGVEEKYVPGDDEFDVPAKLLELNRNNDFGAYADKATGELITCFITDNDITGGNSGSPVMNGKGELIGLAFDGNWEAMSGDIVFDTRYKRTISVDIRYVLFTIDKLAGATNIIKELNLVKGGKKVTIY